MVNIIVWVIELCFKCFMAWALFTFTTWLESPQWMIISATAVGWIETHIKQNTR